MICFESQDSCVYFLCFVAVERAAEARRKEEEAKQKEIESVAQRENAKKARDKEKQALKKARSKFRKMCAEKLEGKQVCRRTLPLEWLLIHCVSALVAGTRGFVENSCIMLAH